MTNSVFHSFPVNLLPYNFDKQQLNEFLASITSLTN